MTAKVEMIGSDKTLRKNPMLILDLVISIMERLSFVDFHRARCVSSLWYSASKSCTRQQAGNPWLVLFPADVLHLPLESIDQDSCKLFDPIDQKAYTVRDLGSDFLRTSCLASYNSWFLMLDRRTRFYLLNILTRERIHLPSLESMESNDGTKLKFKRNFDSSFTVTTYEDNVTLMKTCYGINAAVLWVDERSKDYVVVWAFDSSLAYHKKGDSNWRVFQTPKSFVDMVFKEGKLYVLVKDGSITAFDFSNGDPMEHAIFTTCCTDSIDFEHLAVTLSGQVLAVSKERRHSLISIYKMDTKSSEWCKIESLGDEALVLDQRVTVQAKDGVCKNCVYYINDDRVGRYKEYNLKEDDICVVNMQTKNDVKLSNHLTASSPLPFKDARWFIPTFGGK